MSTHKHIDRICTVMIIAAMLIAVMCVNAKTLGVTDSRQSPGYETRLFDDSSVHTINIVMDDWDGFIENCTDEEYEKCTVIIDNDVYKNTAIRAKGNTSLSNVKNYGNNRYSFKIEFDHYDKNKTYYGLDKLCLNNIIQDNTYMKDYLVYKLMGEFGVDSPLCSYVQIYVNGEPWGLYLAVEGIEDSFLERNYSSAEGELYKPDSQSMGGGRGNGRNFEFDPENMSEDGMQKMAAGNMPGQRPDDSGEMPGQRPDDSGEMPGQRPDDSGEMPGQRPENTGEVHDWMQGKGIDGMKGMSSDDVLLKYIDDSPESYSNIFDNAKTDISEKDEKRLIESLKKLSEGTDIEQVVNIDEVMRYFVVHNFVCNFDSYTGSMIHNYYLYEESGQLSMIPWDYNLAFGGFMGAADASALINYPIDTPVSGQSVEDRPMLAWIFADEKYTELYHEYFSEFINEFFSDNYCEELISATADMLNDYVKNETSGFCTYAEFCTAAGTLEEFCRLRAESVTAQLDGRLASDEEGQKTDQGNMVDASEIDISTMGTMNNGNGGNYFFNGGRGFEKAE